MYQPRHFAMTDEDARMAVVRAYPFATLVTDGDQGVCIDHLPLMVEQTSQGALVLRGHIARANALWRLGEGERADAAAIEAVAIFHGPDAYISPGWYPDKRRHGRVVPTWNYQVVHAHGRLVFPRESDWLTSHLTSLVDRFEAGREAPWAVDDAPEDYLEGMRRGIVGVELEVTRLVGKHKASQQKPLEEREGIREGLREDGRSARDAAVLCGDDPAPRYEGD
ncbi:FMN-binding negative transcriptional regulator [Halomonas sp. YLB-10]|uniref:FMN-binding negative transcriptional regulator n=1 Tax=Halomonas sp. YLB-10 TaxID=2483111 RepID=UPI000F5E7E1F|nr:FMN-binding negative transcriptional regulator [Halomonas sp. YLB-10]RQW69746.1 FMN-binding negative transcriptional regulator [Halomonas sp. YLB-10]